MIKKEIIDFIVRKKGIKNVELLEKDFDKFIIDSKAFWQELANNFKEECGIFISQKEGKTLVEIKEH